jgi:hypothetical protein
MNRLDKLHMHCFPFLSLPAELRNCIYSFVTADGAHKLVLHLPTERGKIHIRGVSRQVYNEVLSLFYSTRIISIPRTQLFPEFRASLGPVGKKCIRGVRITYTLLRHVWKACARWSVQEDHSVLDEFESLRVVELYISG